MSPSAADRGAPPSRPSLIARVALAAALETSGVVAPVRGAGGRWATPDAAGDVPGVVVAARADGCFEVALHLSARPVPLQPLAERVRGCVIDAADRAGLGHLLGCVDVAFEDVVMEGVR